MNRTPEAGKMLRRKPNPILKASAMSKLFYWWVRDLFLLGYHGQITPNEIYATKESLYASRITAQMQERWDHELQKPKPSLLRMLLANYGWQCILGGWVVMMIETVSRTMQPLCLGGLVVYFVADQTEYTQTDAYLFCAGIVMTTISVIVTFHPLIMWLSERSAVIRLGCSGLVYGKILRLPRSAVSDGLHGRMVNLLSSDVARFELALLLLHDVWKGPMETILFGFFIYREIGVSAVIGVGFLLSFVPLQAWVGKKSATLRLKTARRTDYRVKIMNEIIQGIQVIKMYAWENSFAQMVDRIRKKEINAVRQTAYVRATMTSFGMISRLSIFLSILSYIFMGNVITARKVFIVSSYFSILNIAMVLQWSFSLTTVAEGYITVKRIEEFLMMSEQKAKADDSDAPPVTGKNEMKIRNAKESPVAQHRVQNPAAPVKQVVFENVTAHWTSGKDGTVGVRDVSLRIEDGEFCAIIGQVGAGKSTLLHVLLDELSVDSGRLLVDGSVSYASQEAWIFEGSIRSNIIFIEELDEKRYREVVRVCALERDFELLPDGDHTIVGERGITLSGGQKARINLARAVYKQADIYLLDDPLSAVDTHVGKHMFQECISGFLSDKICLLVTHQLQHLKEAMRVIVINQAGVEAQGTFAELRAQNIEALLSTPDESGEQDMLERRFERQRSISCSTIGSDVDEMLDGGRGLGDRAERREEGRVDWSVYKEYLKSVNNYYFVVGIFIISQVCVSGLDYFVAFWVNWEEFLAHHHLQNGAVDALAPKNVLHYIFGTSDTPEAAHRTNYIIAYSVMMAIATIVFVYRTFAFFALCLRASTNLHDRVFRGISRATMLFYNTNPTGRILNRFASDISNIDTRLPPALTDSISAILESLAIMSIVVTVNIWLVIPTICLILLIGTMRQLYIKTARSVKRIESISLSPVYSHATATLQGLSTVRAFGAREILQQEFYRHLDENTAAWFCRVATVRAFAFWLDALCVLYVAAVTITFVAIGNENTPSGNIGLAVLQCINLIGMCQKGIRQTAEVENQMTSIERLLEYASLPSEAPLASAPGAEPPAAWPQAGAIQFEALSFRYTPVGVFVLRDLQLSIAAQEKIGIVGRTGAGKSSLIQAVFRLAELDGAIVIDGVDIRQLGLHELRRKISIIPQDPVLFSGTLRFNLDPFGESTDEELWRALEQVELRPFVAGMAGGLDGRMLDGGSNCSVGQRQMVCLARAILRNNRILILDEATANVDPETDRLIQTTIRSRFGACTVLTIAHRLHTVMDNDRVLVMDAGRAVEFGHPWELLQLKGGFLRQLVDQTGIETAAILMEIATKNYSNKTKTE